MSIYWYIAKERLRSDGRENTPKIELDLWRDYVERDKDLFWFESTPLGEEFFSDPNAKIEDLRKLRKTKAQMDFSKRNGHGNVQLNYLNAESYYYISILHTRTTLERVEKYYDIAQKLNANLYKNKTWVNESIMKKFRDKYSKR